MWWVVTTAPSLERRAQASLVELGFDAWHPQRLVEFKTRHMAKPAKRMYPTFPGYVFVRPSGIVPVWRWERDRGPRSPITGHFSLVGPERRVRVGEQHRMAGFQEALAADGVKAFLVGSDGLPLPITDAEFNHSRDYLDAIANTPVDIVEWRKNDVARITDGPWVGFDGKVVDTSHLAKRGSLMLLLSLFGRQTATEVSAEHLRLLERVA